MNRQQLKRVVVSLLVLSSHQYSVSIDPLSAVAGGMAVAALGTWLGQKLFTTASKTDVLVDSKTVIQEEQTKHQEVLPLLKVRSEDEICERLAYRSLSKYDVSRSLEKLRGQEKKLRNMRVETAEFELEQRRQLQKVEDLEAQLTKLEAVLSSDRFKVYKAHVQLTQDLPDIIDQKANLEEVLLFAHGQCSDHIYPLKGFVKKLESWDRQAQVIQSDADQQGMLHVSTKMSDKRSRLHVWRRYLLTSSEYKKEYDEKRRTDWVEQERERDRQLERKRIETQEERSRREHAQRARELRLKEESFEELRRKLNRRDFKISRLEARIRAFEKRDSEEIRLLRERLDRCLKQAENKKLNPSPEGSPPPGPVQQNGSNQPPKPSAPMEPKGPPACKID